MLYHWCRHHNFLLKWCKTWKNLVFVGNYNSPNDRSLHLLSTKPNFAHFVSFPLGGNLLIDIFCEQSLLFQALKALELSKAPNLSKDVSLSQVRIDIKKKVLTKLDASRVFGNIWNVTFESDILVNFWILLPNNCINYFLKRAGLPPSGGARALLARIFMSSYPYVSIFFYERKVRS